MKTYRLALLEEKAGTLYGVQHVTFHAALPINDPTAVVVVLVEAQKQLVQCIKPEEVVLIQSTEEAKL